MTAKAQEASIQSGARTAPSRASPRTTPRPAGIKPIATGAYAQPLAGGKLRFNLSLQYQPYFNDETVGLEGQPAVASVAWSMIIRPAEQSELGAALHARFRLERVSLETLAIQQLDGEDSITLYNTPGDFERFREQHTNGESIGRTTLTWRAMRPRLTVETGAETAYNWLHSHTRYADNGAGGVQVPAADVDVTELRGEAFAKATWTPARLR